MTTISIGSSTDLGKRESNEDSLLAVMAQDSAPRGSSRQSTGSSALLILADGMGGRSNGQVASQTAVRVVYRELAHILAMRSDSRREYLEKALHNALKQANTRVKNLGNESPDGIGMGTTCTVAIVTRDMVSVAHVGDSRAYICDPDGLHALTEDHSVVGDEVRAGRLTEAEARKSKFRNVITRAVGVDPNIVPDIVSRGLAAGEVSYLIVCSDGLHGALTPADIERTVQRSPLPQDAADTLVAQAKACGASDNISVIVARVDADLRQSDGENGDELGSDGRVSRPSRARFTNAGNLISFAVGLVIAAGIALLATPYMGSVRQIEAGTSLRRVVAAPKPPPIDLSVVGYGAPQSLIGRPLAPGVLLHAGPGLLLVADPAAHRVLSVRTDTGEVATSAPDSADLAAMHSHPVAWAADTDGDLYESTASPPQIRKFNSDGRFLRTIAQGEITAPTAIAVASDGDVFIIDGSRLKRIPATPATPTAAQAPRTSARNSRT